MSVNVFARTTKLHDVCGRVDYISSPERQENLMATATTTGNPDFWHQLANDSQVAFLKTGSKTGNNKCCEGREIIGDLPNSALERDLDVVAASLATDFKNQTGAECTVAIHLNKAQNNLHFHLIYAERELLKAPAIKVADRNAWIDENGIRKRTKKEILDDDGQLRPGCKIIRKGEILEERYFGEKNPMFKDMGWLYSYKQHLADWINQELDPDEKRMVFDRNGPYLAQKHQGRGKPKNREEYDKAVWIRNWNIQVKHFNKLVEAGVIPEDMAKRAKRQIALAPDQLTEIQAIIADVCCEVGDLAPDERAATEALARQASAKKREKEEENEKKERKERLRDAYRRSALAWSEYRNAPDPVSKKALLDEAKKISAEISRLEKQLGYDRPESVNKNQAAIWRAFEENREATQNSEEVQQYLQDIHDDRSEAVEKYQQAIDEFHDVFGYTRTDENGKRVKIPPKTFTTQEERDATVVALRDAKYEYQEAKRQSRAISDAYRLQQQYRSYALRVAADPTATQAEIFLAKDRYKAAMRRLQKPDPRTVKELRRQFSDMQKSQQIRKEKEAAARAAEKGKAEDLSRQ